MKKGNLTRLVLLSGALVIPGYAEKVKFEQLPPDLQEKIRAQVGSAPIDDIDREVKNGKTVYEVAYKKNGQHTELQFEHEGALPSSTLKSSSTANTALDSRKIRYEELPAAIKRIADEKLQGAEVNDVDRQVKNGRTTYEIGYKQNDGGPQQELVISDDGRIIRQRAREGRGPRENIGLGQNRATSSSSKSNNSVATRAMNYSDLPGNVRRVADSRLRAGNVSQVERRVENGQISYRISFKKDNGQMQELVVAEDGRVVRDETGKSVGSSGVFDSGSKSSVNNAGNSVQNSEYAYVTSPVQLRNPVEMNRAELPTAVRRAARQHASNRDVEEVLRGEWRGNSIYQVGFTDENNRYVELQLDENGKVVYDPRTTGGAANSSGNVLNNLGRALFDNK